jgi:hypothetical protein
MTGDRFRYFTAYHEAGHALAAAKCPEGRVDEIDIRFNPFVADERGATKHDHRPEDQAFIIYAGPWAHARAVWPGETIDLDRVLAFLRSNTDDWVAFQKVHGHNVGPNEVIQLGIAASDGGIGPREYRPSLTWHEAAAEVLTRAWAEIEELAEKMLAGEREIKLGNGHRLVREPDVWPPNIWRNPEVPSDVESK